MFLIVHLVSEAHYTGYKKASCWSTGIGEDNFLILEKCSICIIAHLINIFEKKGEVKNEEF